MDDPPPPGADGPANEYAEILARASHGDDAAMAEIARRYEAKVRVVARVMLGRALRSYVDSVDLVQSVHKSVLVGLRNQRFAISDPDKLTALAVLIARRKVARHWRKMQRQHRLSAARGDEADGDDAVKDLASSQNPVPDPAATVEARDQIAQISRHLGDLDRRILELRSLDYNAPEIADRLAIAPVVVRVRLTRLRQKLQGFGISID